MALKIKKYSLHLTNIKGLGATQLFLSLLPSLEKISIKNISYVYIPDAGSISDYFLCNSSLKVIKYRRFLPNTISRFIECQFFNYFFSPNSSLLICGDMPLANVKNQTVFLHNRLLISTTPFRPSLLYFKHLIIKKIFAKNSKFVKAFIVQTKDMRDGLISEYSIDRNKIFVIPQPPPIWLIDCGFSRKSRFLKGKLSLIYPAANYPHKNHILLSKLSSNEASSLPIKKLFLTIDKKFNPLPAVSWVSCISTLTPNEILNFYKRVDALLFLSLEESFGLPLIEAMYIGLPIICPDLPYAKSLCGDQAIYFNPFEIRSLEAAIYDAHKKISYGWWPDWSSQKINILSNWDIVAKKILNIVIT